jgi:hypothetical protein
MEPDSMENSKLESMQRALDQWMQQHPELIEAMRNKAREITLLYG